MEQRVDALQQRTGYRFTDPALLTRALTHRSFGTDHNERLEFLGDAVLSLAVSSLLFDRLGGSDEGDLTRRPPPPRPRPPGARGQPAPPRPPARAARAAAPRRGRGPRRRRDARVDPRRGAAA